MIDFAQLIDESRIIVCCGSGGVGKTTSSAALAVAAARRGRRVVLVTIDPARRLADALGLQRLSNDPTEVMLSDGTKFSALMLDARATFDEVVRRTSRSEAQAREILGNPFYVNVASRLGGSQEYMAAEKLHELHDDARFDLVVVDTPPTQEALDFLDAPRKLTSFLDHRVYKWLMAPGAGRPTNREFRGAADSAHHRPGDWRRCVGRRDGVLPRFRRHRGGLPRTRPPS